MKEDPTRLKVCVNIKVLNKVKLKYHFPTPSNEIINRVAGHVYYLFTNGYFGYNQVPPVTNED